MVIGIHDNTNHTLSRENPSNAPASQQRTSNTPANGSSNAPATHQQVHQQRTSGTSANAGAHPTLPTQELCQNSGISANGVRAACGAAGAFRPPLLHFSYCWGVLAVAAPF